jgi:2-iminobutanoate/2-iminopropanoate deaminase
MTINRTSAGPGLPSGFPFSLSGDVNGTCFISGMPALNAEGKFQAGTFVEETQLAWQNIVSIAKASGYAQDEITDDRRHPALTRASVPAAPWFD